MMAQNAAIRLSAACLVFVLALAGCTPAAPSRDDVSVAVDPVIAQEQIAAFGACVRAEGFEFVDPPLTVVQAQNTDVGADEFLQEEDSAEIAAIGYGIVETFEDEVSDSASESGDSDPNAQIYTDLDDSVREAYLATYATCSEQHPFRNAITVDDVDHLEEDIYTRTVNSEGYVSAMTEWSSCFAAQTGEQFETPDRIQEVLLSELGGTYSYESADTLLFDPGPFDIGLQRVVDNDALRTLRSKELEYARVDFDCQRQAQLSEAVNDAFEKAQDEQ